MAELAPPWGKFGHPSGQVRQRNCPGLLLDSQTSVVGNCKGPIKCNGIDLTHGLSELVLRNEPENFVLICPSFRLAF